MGIPARDLSDAELEMNEAIVALGKAGLLAAGLYEETAPDAPTMSTDTLPNEAE